MTSFLIQAHETRGPSPWSNDTCAFCRIINNESPAVRVFENDQVIAILDILPLRKGHTLVIPKAHVSRLSELPPELAAAVGEAVTKVAHALTLALDNTGLNVVCNQEYAQAVPHVHYHVIPAPTFGKQPSEAPSKVTEPLTRREMHQREFEGRSELDDDDATVLADKIRSKL
ncbi:HIT-like domain-containing protein [Mycena rosella]|uniref:HIT-like domain-containing protein n=1 Tax=Mycena rosella TaxID=1033263 RepID=A0AAD7GKV5_MYCRO|nr:HIT-like domain-containing protein [Mycena rosella]